MRTSKGPERSHASSANGDLDTDERGLLKSPPGDLTWLLDTAAACLRTINAELGRAPDPIEACRRWIQPLKALAASMERVVALDDGPGYANSGDSTLAASGAALHSPTGELTRRERQVMQYVEKGLPYAKIARKLDIDVQTVYTHMKNVRRKQRDRAAGAGD